MTPNTASTPCSPRFVTVIVGSDISELRSEPARARATRSVRPRMISPRFFLSTSWIAGAMRPPWRIEMATPRWMPLAGWNAPFTQKPFSSGTFAERERHGLQLQGAHQQPLGDGRFSFSRASHSAARCIGTISDR